MSKVRRVNLVDVVRSASHISTSNKDRSRKYITDLTFMLLMAVVALVSLALARQVQPSVPIGVVGISTPAASSAPPTPTHQLNLVEQAIATQEAIGYPGPIPTSPPPPGAPTPDPLYQLRVNLRWTPYSAYARYVTQNGNTLTVTFGVTDSIYPGVSAWNTQASVKVILSIIAHSHMNYRGVILRGIKGYTNMGSEPPAITLEYSRKVIESRDWLAQPIGDGENIYKLADRSQIEDDLVPRPLPTQPPQVGEDPIP